MKEEQDKTFTGERDHLQLKVRKFSYGTYYSWYLTRFQQVEGKRKLQEKRRADCSYNLWSSCKPSDYLGKSWLCVWSVVSGLHLIYHVLVYDCVIPMAHRLKERVMTMRCAIVCCTVLEPALWHFAEAQSIRHFGWRFHWDEIKQRKRESIGMPLSRVKGKHLLATVAMSTSYNHTQWYGSGSLRSNVSYVIQAQISCPLQLLRFILKPLNYPWTYRGVFQWVSSWIHLLRLCLLFAIKGPD